MENPEIFIYLLVGIALGAVIGWLGGTRKGAEAEAENRAAEQRLEALRGQSAEVGAALKQRCHGGAAQKLERGD